MKRIKFEAIIPSKHQRSDRDELLAAFLTTTLAKFAEEAESIAEIAKITGRGFVVTLSLTREVAERLDLFIMRADFAMRQVDLRAELVQWRA